MDFRLTPEQAAFQREVLSFIDHGLPAGWDAGFESLAAGLEVERDIMKRLAAKNWLALPWPREFGGLGASPMQQLIFNEQLAYHRVPGTVNMGVAWVGPVVMLYGTDQQKADYLGGIASGEQLWCTLYSEPGAGSDLAAMQTRAVRDGDDFLINGQKIWTTFGHYADWGWLACRTDPNAPKHKGISTFAVKMDSPGITVRPLVNMTGSHEFNEIYFEDVRIPAAQMVGEENRGWYNVAVGLDFERSSIGATSAPLPTQDSARLTTGVVLVRSAARSVRMKVLTCGRGCSLGPERSQGQFAALGAGSDCSFSGVVTCPDHRRTIARVFPMSPSPTFTACTRRFALSTARRVARVSSMSWRVPAMPSARGDARRSFSYTCCTESMVC